MVSILGTIFDFKLNSASKLLRLKISFTSSQNDKIINSGFVFLNNYLYFSNKILSFSKYLFVNLYFSV